MNKPDRTQQKIRVFLKDGTLLKTMDWDKCFERPAGTEPFPVTGTSVSVEVGAMMADGSVFVGLTADGKQQIYAMPTDLDVTMTFNGAAKAVKKLNSDKALGHDDWQIPALENVYVLYKNKNEGALKGTFNTSGNKASGSGFPDWYWSSTEYRDDPSIVWDVRFSDGNEVLHRKDGLRLSCRPVRLVEASSPAPG